MQEATIVAAAVQGMWDLPDSTFRQLADGGWPHDVFDQILAVCNQHLSDRPSSTRAASSRPVTVPVRLRLVADVERWLVPCADPTCPSDTPETSADPAGRGQLLRGHLARTADDAAGRCRHVVTADARHVTVDHPQAFTGVTRHDVDDQPPDVTVTIPARFQPDRYPQRRSHHRHRQVPAVTVTDPAEHLLHVLAHELCHADQFVCGLPASEPDAERWANTALIAWRAQAV